MSSVESSPAAGALIAATIDPPRAVADPPRMADGALHRRRWWLVWSSSVIAVIAALRLAAPSIVAAWLTSSMGAELGVAAQIEDVELGLLTGEIEIRGIHAAPPADASASSLDIDVLTLRWRWRDLLRGIARVDGRVSGVDVVVDLQRPWPAVRDPASARPSRLRSLAVESGSVRVVMAADTPPLLALTGLHGRMTRTSGHATETMTTHFSVAAETGDGGSFTLVGASAPVEPAASWTLRFTLDRLDLRPLNPLFEQVLEMDVERGWLSLEGGVTLGMGRCRGRIHPRFEELQLLGHGERQVRHPMGEALFSSMLSGAELPIDIDQAVLSTGDSVLDALAGVDAMELLGDIILRGFIRRLATLDGYEPAAARVEVDFPSGRLSFFDITLTRDGGGVGRPFVSIARMDIVIEPSAVDREAVTYKSIALHEPSLVFVTGETPANSQITFDPEWQAKVNVLPYPTDLVEIFDGRIEYRDDTTRPPTSLVVSDLHLRAEKLGRAREHEGRRGATLVGSGRVMDLSALTIAIDFTPGVVELDAAARLRLEPLPLRDLNQLLAGRLGVDVSSGTLALTADLEAHDGHLQGRITPRLDDVRVLGVDEREVEHPVRELMLERRLRKLDGATLTLDRRVRTSVLRELPAALMSGARHAL